jgi:outer membrane receptor protein involved in Fe transport
MSNRNEITRAVRHALVVSAMAAAAPAIAQQPASTAGSVSLEEVTVTGSRIVRRDFEAASPVVTVGSELLETSGTKQIEQILNTLPQLNPNVTTTSNNPSNGGQANVDLRGLGTQRTLVLVDGVRVVPSNTTGVVDLNVIPGALIQNIEILTGGASSTYGSDAVAGVVNIITKRNFEGVQIDATYGQTAESDGMTMSGTLTLGGNLADGRGNMVMTLGYDEREEVLAGSRDFSRVSRGAQLQPLGSTTIPEGSYLATLANLPSQAAFNTQFGPGVPNTGSIAFNSPTSIFSMNPVRGFTGDTTDPGFNPNAYSYNFAPVNYLQLPLERRQIAAFGHYALSDDVEVYGKVLYTTYFANQQLAATPVTCAGAQVGCSVPMTNPLIPAPLRTILNSRPTPGANFTFFKRTTEVGARSSNNNYDAAQAIFGVKGGFEAAERRFNWDVYGTYGRGERTELQGGNVSRSRLQSVLNNPNALSSQGCTNFNPFGTGSISAPCAAAIAVRATNVTQIEQENFVGSISGELFQLPAGWMQGAVGAEYRRQEANFRPDEFLASGDVVGFNAQRPVSGVVQVKEYFAEVSVPILDDIPAIDYLGVDLGFRYSDYDLAGGQNTYKAALDWAPLESVKVRASYARAIRAASIQELFLPPQENFPTIQDACWNGSPERTGASAAQVNALCASQGLPANFPQGNAQARTIIGGNPNLDPETADTYTFGVVWQPSFGEQSVRLSLDWWRYRLEDTIGSVQAGSIVSRCFNGLGANPTFDPNNEWCRSFTRTPAGTITDIQAINRNIGATNIDGIDLQVDYSLPLSVFGAERWGAISANLLATKQLTWEFQEDPQAPFVDILGTINSTFASATPELKAVLQLGWDVSDFTARWNMQYVDGMDAVNNNALRTPATGTAKPGTPSYTVHRLTVGWSGWRGLSLLLGVNNLFDEEPPIYTNTSQAGIQSNTDPSTFDVLGRRYFMNASYKF